MLSQSAPWTLLFKAILVCFVAWISAQGFAHAATFPPRQQLFDRDWKFHLGDVTGADRPEFDDSTWRTLDLPHDWSIETPFDPKSPAGAGGGYLNGGIGWYRKTFSLPDASADRRVTILFDGAYQNAQVAVNGHPLGFHPYGFTSFYYDLTPFLMAGRGQNVLSVRLQVNQPGCRWYSGAGLYRHVWLLTTQALHLTPWGIDITTPRAQAFNAEVKIATEIENSGPNSAVTALRTILLDPTGKQVAGKETTQPILPGRKISLVQTFLLPTAALWSPEQPSLYHAVSEVRIHGIPVDSTTTSFGIRTIRFTKDRGFFLNGRHLQIQGVCDHHDLGCLGAAAYRRALERQLEVIKSLGANALRTSHNPPSPELLDLCDKMGILVMDEAFDEWKENHQTYGYAMNFDQWSEPDLVSMLRRDRNHPSIILWSIGNEIPEGNEGKPEAGVTAKRLVAICHREDPTRPVTSACPNPTADWSSGLAPALDVFGVNYNPSWYEKNNPANAPAPSGDLGYHGQLPLIGSETASQVDSRGEYGLTLDAQGRIVVDPKPDHQVSSYDYFQPDWANSGETDLLALKKSPWVAGEFVWTGFDYLGEPTPFSWPSRSSYFGLVDLDGFPKDRYYLYKSQWSREPLVHILPMSWTWPGFEGKAIPVRVFTNAETVELFLNGTSLGKQSFPADCAPQTEVHENKDKTMTTSQSPGLHLAWKVPYAPGELKAVASRSGQVVATDILRTAGAPAQITLTPDRNQITGSGQDLAFVKVAILDHDGNLCPEAGNEVTFQLSGPAATLAGVSDGDATNHESFQGHQHQVFHGLGLVVLKSRYGAAGTVTLTASSPYLANGVAVVTVRAADKSLVDAPVP